MSGRSVVVSLLVMSAAGCGPDAPGGSSDVMDADPDVAEVAGDAVGPAALDAQDSPEPRGETETRADADPGPPPPISLNAVACDHPDHWRYQLSHATEPLVVHYERLEEAATAAEVLELVAGSLEAALERGFRRPPLDGGACGPDEAFDVFLWRGQLPYVDVLGDLESTVHTDQIAYLVVDPWDTVYGAEQLPATVRHELTHACQAADDWWESDWVFEATATWMESLAYPGGFAELAEDFQVRADWSLGRSDGYATWFMYGAALYFHFVGAELLSDRPTFVGDMWHELRNPDGPDEPDWADALDGLLSTDAGTGLLESVVEFSRWRWHAGDVFAGVSSPPVSHTTTVSAGLVTVEPGPMEMGTVYIAVTGTPADVVVMSLGSKPFAGLRFALADVAGAIVLDLAATPLAVTLPGSGEVILALTALPEGEYEPSTTTDERFPATLVMAADRNDK